MFCYSLLLNVCDFNATEISNFSPGVELCGIKGVITEKTHNYELNYAELRIITVVFCSYDQLQIRRK